MKTILTFIFYALMATSISAQVVVGNININELDHVKVCQVVATGNIFSKKVIITIDYGQQRQGRKASTILTPAGKKQTFHSAISAMNYMLDNGWIYFDALALNDPDYGGNVYHYYFKKDLDWKAED